MTEITSGIFVGDMEDYNSIKGIAGWAVLHCCKHPFHRDFVGYRGNLSPSHPDYLLKRRGNEMALNLVDLDFFDPKYVEHHRVMFSQAFAFLDEYRAKGNKLLIHCEKGESRSPTIGMLYAARLGAFGYAGFPDTMKQMHRLYPRHAPKENIKRMVRHLWGVFVVEHKRG